MAYHKDAVDIINHTILYKTTSLLPDGYYPSNEPYQLALLPLCSGKDHFGTLLIDMDFPADFIFGTLQESISHILKSRNLYLNKVKAEQELTQALNTISKSEERFREMAFTLPTIIFELDLDLNIQYINDVGMRTLKIAQEELDKKLSIYDLVNPGDHPKLSNFCKDTLNQTKLNYFELKFARDDVKQTLLIRSMPLYNANQYKGIRWNAIDIKPWMISFATPSETFFNQYRLSQREREVFTLMVSGLNKKEIAEKLYIAESTVKDHISRIYAVTGVKNKGELFEAIQKFQGLRFGPESYLFSILSKIIKD